MTNTTLESTDLRGPVILFTGLVLGVLVGSALKIDVGNQTIDGINMWSQVIMALIAVGGIGIYVSQKKDESNLAGVDLISFFRKEVMETMSKTHTILIDTIGMTPQIKFGPNSKPEEIKILFPNEYQFHTDILAKILSAPNGGLDRARLFIDYRSDTLNLMEEFAQKVIHLGIIRHEALFCIRKAFVREVERNALRIIQSRQEEFSKSIYRGILILYLAWRDEIDPEPKSFGFATGE